MTFEATHGSTYRIKFNHELAGKRKQPTTSCMLQVQEKDGKWSDTAYNGEAKTHEGDRFCKETGRRISLTRALSRMDRVSRARGWASYWSRVTATSPVMPLTGSQLGVVLH